MQGKLRKIIEEKFSGHITIGPMTIYGFNAMHCAINISTRRWGYICCRPPIKCFGERWGWYFYISPNATPWQAIFAIGPGLGKTEKRHAKIRRLLLGWRFETDEPLAQPHGISDAIYYLGNKVEEMALIRSIED